MTAFRETSEIRSWGGVVRSRCQVAAPSWSDELPAIIAEGRAAKLSLLPTGLHRSYGDSALNPDGGLIDMRGLDRVITFDPATRRICAEAGISFDTILRIALPHNLFLPVTPGTRFVTLGGAIANDVHGKNHHRNGTLGKWVRRLHLLRTDGSEVDLTPEDKSGLFAATVGGLGLTGIITRAEIELTSIPSSLIESETIPFSGLKEFFALARESETGYEHTVAWVDCLAKGPYLGRGIFIRGNHAADGPPQARLGSPRVKVPFAFPSSSLNRYSVGTFNRAYYWRKGRPGRGRESIGTFFYPLDGIANWNLIYGGRGFYQYQSAVPAKVQEQATHEMLEAISRSGQGSFLAVLKTFGTPSSPGLLSFPCPGTTLALDFPNQGQSTLVLLAQLDDIVLRAGGRLYPAKDGRMPSQLFKAGYPKWPEFAKHVDQGMQSRFWNRVINDHN